jgi:hypothetical protein
MSAIGRPGPPLAVPLLLLLSLAMPALADTVDARCEFIPKAKTQPRLDLPCRFSQRQGQVGIARSDGVRHDWSPAGPPGQFTDDTGRRVLRVKGLGASGQVFELPEGRLLVRWATDPVLPPTPLPERPAHTGPFDRSLSLKGITFRVQAANDSSIGRLRVTPSGLKIDNSAWEREVDGQVVGADVADLDADGSPELYVYVQSAGSGSYGSVAGFAANARKSLSEVALPALDDQPGAARGYQGHDRFAVVGDRLLRRFPVYRDGDPNAQPGGGVRQLQYRLARGEAGFVLRLERMTEF